MVVEVFPVVDLEEEEEEVGKRQRVSDSEKVFLYSLVSERGNHVLIKEILVVSRISFIKAE